jgi:chemotaxis protein histidine kinase CheA
MFNASIVITELLGKTLENCAKELATRCIKECASRHDFDADEEIRLLGLENLNLVRKQMAKKSGSKKEKAQVAPKEKKSSFPLPFEASNINKSGCQGLAFNRGLFTQCQKKCMENGSFCNGCQSEADKNASGCPDCGTVSSRLTSGLYEFKDPNGRKPISYAKVLKKLKLTEFEALTEAGKKNIELSDEHFNSPCAEKKGKGRPKKIVKEIKVGNVADLFANLTADVDENLADLMEEVAEEDDTSSKSSKKGLTDEEKAVKKAALEKERAEKKQEREAKLAKEKEEKKAALEQERAEKKAEKEAKIAQEKAEKEAKIAQEKAEKEAKIAQEKAEREAKRKAEKDLAEQKKKENKSSSKAPTKSVEVAPQEPAPSKVSVTRIVIQGVMYLKTSNNVLYNTDKEEVGTYDPETKTIKPLPEEDEEEEEEYDE